MDIEMVGLTVRPKVSYIAGCPKPRLVVMGIKAPRGEMVLLKSNSVDRQCQAIKAFMEEHNENIRT